MSGPVTAAEREAEFRKDLEELCRKHGAEIEVTDDRKPYGMQSGICVVNMYAVYEDGELKKEDCDFEL